MPKPCLMISMPTGGQVMVETVKSLIGLTQYLQKNGITFAFQTYAFSDIVFSRNQLVSSFLSDERFTHILMLDSDVSFPTRAIARLIGFEAPFTAATYPQKFHRWNTLRQLIEAESESPEKTPIETLLARSWRYTLQASDFGGGSWRARHRDGFMTVPSVGTGVMLVAREVLEKMIERGAAPRLARHENLIGKQTPRYHDFFSHRQNADGSFLYAEDQSFCQRWVVECGEDIWLDTTAEITHWGQTGFAGRYDAVIAEDGEIPQAV